MSNFVSYLPEYIPGKLIPRNFGHIKHMSGSRLIDTKDSYLDPDMESIFTTALRDRSDQVVISEKIDGMNCGTVKLDGKVYPINRKGYDVRGMGASKKFLSYLGYTWAKWVSYHYTQLDQILAEGERLVFENAILTHTSYYSFKGSPVFLLAKYNAEGIRVPHAELEKLTSWVGIELPPTINIGLPLSPQIVLDRYCKSIAGSRKGPEGIVYKYEHQGTHIATAKFVSNTCMSGGPVIPQYLNKFDPCHLDATYDPGIAGILGMIKYEY